MCRHTHRTGEERARGPEARDGRETDRGETAAVDSVRRRPLLVSGAAALAALAGCGSSDSGDAPEPVDLTTEDRCDVCGMVIPNHPGPSAEIFYADNRPSGHDDPARFDSTWEAFQYDFERNDRGWDREAFYVTDYSEVDYSVTEEGGDSVVSTHPDAGAFADAESVTFVVGSEVKGAMGRDLIAFSEGSDAEAFADEHGGSLAALGDVTPETIAQLGRA
ncbi:nitrous oxide reductase accessory protein NosL [Halosimplex rubrum]|uniref:Nitrous oxide reductase accessory protein NosL n=1 Tax=Halosimplex rubrum TaxID=869889 RepID=A0A7D5PBG7_9EURY|nr:nitrous oxide reductase accessory protein NosL [Halosimplex rubrum]QLH79000.1 nitrous oxide reductase accessory protein NosL [Halosimplex rubrum]